MVVDLGFASGLSWQVPGRHAVCSKTHALKQQYLLLNCPCKFSCIHELSILVQGSLAKELYLTHW
jgi:hypothetical protein